MRVTLNEELIANWRSQDIFHQQFLVKTCTIDVQTIDVQNSFNDLKTVFKQKFANITIHCNVNRRITLYNKWVFKRTAFRWSNFNCYSMHKIPRKWSKNWLSLFHRFFFKTVKHYFMRFMLVTMGWIQFRLWSSDYFY